MLLILSVVVPLLTGLSLIASGNSRKTPKLLLEVSAILTSILVYASLFTMRGISVRLFPLFSNLEISFRIDGLGMVFAGLVALLWPFAILYAYEYMENDNRQNGFFGFYILTYGVTLGIAYAENLPTMYFFYEMLTIVTFPLVLHYRDQKSRSAARKYLYYSLGGAAFGFIGMVFVIIYGETPVFRLGGVFPNTLPQETVAILHCVFLLAFFGFGVKAALFPFQKWLPIASVAPTPVTALLHAVAVVKAGAFALIRLLYFIYGTAFLKGTLVHYIASGFVMFTIVYGSTMAVREIHFKRRLAYSTVANLSYVLLGAIMLSESGEEAAILHLLIHAIMKITSFFCAGAVLEKARKSYVFELDGLGRVMPITFTCFTISSLSLTGIPLFAGFISKWYIAQACSKEGILGIIAMAVLLYSAAMTAIYMLTISVRAFFPKKGFDYGTLVGIKDPGWKMLTPIVLFSILVILVGIDPMPLVRLAGLVAGGAL